MKKDIKIQPLGSRILAKPDQVEEKTVGGLLLPPSSADEKKPETGLVVKLGKGKVKGKDITFDIAVGDRIYFKKYSPEEIELDGEKYLLLDTEDILAIIK